MRVRLHFVRDFFGLGFGVSSVTVQDVPKFAPTTEHDIKLFFGPVVLTITF